MKINFDKISDLKAKKKFEDRHIRFTFSKIKFPQVDRYIRFTISTLFSLVWIHTQSAIGHMMKKKIDVDSCL